MIKLLEIHIEEIRGIRNLTLRPDGKNFVVHGPNGSGKSGIVDAIDFGLTGSISRLAGKGTGQLKLKTHGPHVDSRSSLKNSLVRLTLELTKLGETVTIERTLNNPKDLLVTPPDQPDIQAVLDDVVQHSELTLSRREIIKYILSEGKTRSKDVQALLKLDELGQIRDALKTASNTLSRNEKGAKASLKTSEEDLIGHLGIPELTSKSILDSVNTKRQLLNLQSLTDLSKDTAVNIGLSTKGRTAESFSRATALLDLTALSEHLAADTGKQFVEECVVQFDVLKTDPVILQQLKLSDFYEQGLALLNEDGCPLCDTKWEIEELVTHLKAKIDRVKAVRATQEKLTQASNSLQSYVQRLVELLKRSKKIAQDVNKGPEGSTISMWIVTLNSMLPKLSTVEGALEVEDEIRGLWRQSLSRYEEVISDIHAAVSAKPDDSAEVKARDFLTIAHERLQKWWSALHECNQCNQSNTAALTALEAYTSTIEETLGGLYAQVESKLSEYYCFINQDDEAKFSAKLEHKESALNLEVDFHNRGLFPPSAYHSEGHQDGMGLCLYLALMQQMLRDEFTFVVLDDVVMSVDTQHRREFCNLLKTKFPDTQFILTTHDQAWHKQMKSHGLISSKSSVSFRNWTVEHGPLVAASLEVWQQIDNALEDGDVPAAAAKLRRHLEYVAHELAESLRAPVPFRGDGNYALDSLMSPALSRYPKYLKEAKSAAQSWSNDELKASIGNLLETFQAKQKVVKAEKWATNSAVHYNSWANFSKEEFQSVVKAWRELLSSLHCEKCETWLYVSPSMGTVEALRCRCAETNLNLKKK